MIGVGITTRNRPHQLIRNLEQHQLLSQPGNRVVVVDDASERLPLPRVPRSRVIYLYNQERRGIARSKNRCLANLADCEFLFLFDDDCHPVGSGWEEAYIHAHRRTGIHHFNLLSPRCAGQLPLEEIEVNGFPLWRSRGYGGPMLFLTREVLKQVGGFNPAFGLYGGEHGGYSDRITRAPDLMAGVIIPGPRGSVGLRNAHEFVVSLDFEKAAGGEGPENNEETEDRGLMAQANRTLRLEETSPAHSPLFQPFMDEA